MDELLDQVYFVTKSGRVPIFDVRFATLPVAGMLTSEEAASQGVVLTTDTGSVVFGAGGRGATRDRWAGRVWNCHYCDGVNPCGMLVCIECSAVVLFMNPKDNTVMFSPVGASLARQVPAALGVQENVTQVFDRVAIAKGVVYGGLVGQMSLHQMIKNRATHTIHWQTKWLFSQFDKPEGLGEKEWSLGCAVVHITHRGIRRA